MDTYIPDPDRLRRALTLAGSQETPTNSDVIIPLIFSENDRHDLYFFCVYRMNIWRENSTSITGLLNNMLSQALTISISPVHALILHQISPPGTEMRFMQTFSYPTFLSFIRSDMDTNPHPRLPILNDLYGRLPLNKMISTPISMTLGHTLNLEVLKPCEQLVKRKL
jgi:hypothetical protein